MGDVRNFGGTTRLDLSPRQILEEAVNSKVSPVVVIGLDESGSLYVAGSEGDIDQSISLITRAQSYLCKIAEENDE